MDYAMIQDSRMSSSDNLSKGVMDPRHPLFGIFELHNFPPDGSATEHTLNALTEALLILNAGLQAMCQPDSFERYFPATAFPHVMTVFTHLTEILNVRWGTTLPSVHSQASNHPDLLPIKVFYKYARKDTENLTEQKGLAIFCSVKPYDGAPLGAQEVPRYIVLCPLSLSVGPNTHLCPETAPRGIFDGHDPGTFAGFCGEGTANFPKGGMWSTSAAIARELLHFDDIYGHVTFNIPIRDLEFTPNGCSRDVVAYSAWKCQQLRRQIPDLCLANSNNYIWFALEHLHKNRWKALSNCDIIFTDTPWNSFYDADTLPLGGLAIAPAPILSALNDSVNGSST